MTNKTQNLCECGHKEPIHRHPFTGEKDECNYGLAYNEKCPCKKFQLLESPKDTMYRKLVPQTQNLCECGHFHNPFMDECRRPILSKDKGLVGYCACKKFKPRWIPEYSDKIAKKPQTRQTKPLKTLTAKGVPIHGRKEDKTAEIFIDPHTGLKNSICEECLRENNQSEDVDAIFGRRLTE